MNHLVIAVTAISLVFVLGIVFQLVQLVRGRTEELLSFITFFPIMVTSYATVHLMHPHWGWATATVVGEYAAVVVSGLIVQKYTYPIIRQRVRARYGHPTG